MQESNPARREDRERETGAMNDAHLRAQGFRPVSENPGAQKAENQGEKICGISEGVQKEIRKPGAKTTSQIANRSAVARRGPAWIR